MLKASQTLADLPKHVINLDVALLAHLDHFHARISSHLQRSCLHLAFRRLCCSAFFSIGDDGFLGITDALEDVTRKELCLSQGMMMRDRIG